MCCNFSYIQPFLIRNLTVTIKVIIDYVTRMLRNWNSFSYLLQLIIISTEHYAITLELLDINGILFIEEICRLLDTEITIFTNLQLCNFEVRRGTTFKPWSSFHRYIALSKTFLCDIFIYYIFGAYLKSRTITNSTFFVDIEWVGQW